MSRIESALEKATRLRSLEQGPAQDGAVADTDRPLVVPKNSLLVTLADPNSPAAEAYRKLKAMFMKLTQQDATRNAIVVTSAGSGEGKSLTSANLAISLAQEVGRSALLIDADLRRPSLAGYLDISAETGLADCLRDGAPAASAIIKTGIPKLDILPAGKGVRNPVELLSSPKMRSLLVELKRQDPKRFIIIDTPPLLPFAETQVISQLADGVLLVVKEGATTMREAQDCLDILAGTKVVGIAFNDVSAQGANSRYLRYYQYYADHQRRSGVSDHV